MFDPALFGKRVMVSHDPNSKAKSINAVIRGMVQESAGSIYFIVELLDFNKGVFWKRLISDVRLAEDESKPFFPSVNPEEIEVGGRPDGIPDLPEDPMVDAPNNELWGTFAGDKWDHEYSRNVLLHFIEQNGLTDRALAWINNRWPSDRD